MTARSRDVLGEAAAGPRRRVLRPAVGLRIALAAVIAAAVTLGGRESAIARADSLVRIDPVRGRAVGVAALEGQPTAVTVCAGSVWITIWGGRVVEIDPESSSARLVRLRGTPRDVADVGNVAAVVSGPPRALTAIDAQFGRISGSIPLSGPESSLMGTAVAVGANIWVANPGGRELARLDPPYTEVAGRLSLGGRPRLVASGEGSLWVAGARILWQVDAPRRRVHARLRLSFSPLGLDVGSGGIWLVNQAAGELVRVDPAAMKIVARIPVGRNPQAVAVGAGAVWVANRSDGTVSRIDPRRNLVVETIGVRSSPMDLVAGLGSVWVVRRTS